MAKKIQWSCYIARLMLTICLLSAVLTLQNGLGNPETIAREPPDSLLLAGVTSEAADRNVSLFPGGWPPLAHQEPRERTFPSKNTSLGSSTLVRNLQRSGGHFSLRNRRGNE